MALRGTNKIGLDLLTGPRFYCIWDSFRVQHPLLTIIDPDAQTDMLRALIDIYRHEGTKVPMQTIRCRANVGKLVRADTEPGKLPDCRMSFCKGYTQGGSNADVVIADAFVKNLTAGIDWETAYEAVVSDAEGRAHTPCFGGCPDRKH